MDLHHNFIDLQSFLEKLDQSCAESVMQMEKVKKSQEYQVKFYNCIIKQVLFHQKKSNDLLQMQMFSQQMMGNLINDLLDLAKLENSSFTLDQGYFSLSDIVYQAFQMLLYSSNQLGVELSAEIDDIAHLNLIQSLHGDQRRYL